MTQGLLFSCHNFKMAKAWLVQFVHSSETDMNSSMLREQMGINEKAVRERKSPPIQRNPLDKYY